MTIEDAIHQLKRLRIQTDAAVTLLEAGSYVNDPLIKSFPYDMIVGDFAIKERGNRFVGYKGIEEI